MSSATESAVGAESGGARLRAILDAFLDARGRLGDNLERLAKGYGLCGSQVLVLLDVIAHPGTGLTGLCARTGLKKSAASKHVEALAGKGLLARSGIADDRRVLALEACSALAEKGFCAGSSIAAIFPGWKEGSPRDDELDSILAALRRLSELLETTP